MSLGAIIGSVVGALILLACVGACWYWRKAFFASTDAQRVEQPTIIIHGAQQMIVPQPGAQPVMIIHHQVHQPGGFNAHLNPHQKNTQQQGFSVPQVSTDYQAYNVPMAQPQMGAVVVGGAGGAGQQQYNQQRQYYSANEKQQPNLLW